MEAMLRQCPVPSAQCLLVTFFQWLHLPDVVSLLNHLHFFAFRNFGQLKFDTLELSGYLYMYMNNTSQRRTLY